MTKKLSKRGFTLVELIIVIAIIAILAVTAFLLLTKRLAKARDASRSSNLANIENSLQISLTENSSLPKPDNYTLIYASGTTNVVGYQGDFGEGVKDSVGNINSAPKDGDDYFVYYLSNDLKSYQIGALMENEVVYNSNVVSAEDYSSRFINVKGSQLGMLFDANKSPVNKLGLTGVDIQNTTSSYIAYFDNNNKVSGTGFILKSLKGGGNLAFGLIGYWSFDEGVGTTVYDNSGKGNNGTLSGTTLPTWTGGKNSGGIYITGGNATSSWIPLGQTSDSSLLNFSGKNSITITSLVKPLNMITNEPSRGGTIISSTDGYGLSQRIGTGFLFADFRFVGETGLNNNYKFNYSFVENNYYFLATEYNQDKIIYYVNGLKIGEIQTQGKPLTNRTGGIMSIGCDPTGFLYGGLCFNGIIDEVRLYNRALTESEVKSLYDATK